MMNKYYYLIKIQFLGFRYSGWQKQADVKTVQGMIDKTFRCIFEHENFKTLGAGRTDAKVSANQFSFELFISDEQNTDELLVKMNTHLPPDIRALEVTSVSQKFNIINDSKRKEYLYLFTDEKRVHPFCAPFLVPFSGPLDMDLMKEGAKLFIGLHNFEKYCYKPSEKTIFEREILLSEIVVNDLYSANFFPEKSWVYRVEGKGFLRHQIRLMIGTLVRLGKGELSLEDINASLRGGDNNHLAVIAPSSGLSLNRVEFLI